MTFSVYSSTNAYNGIVKEKANYKGINKGLILHTHIYIHIQAHTHIHIDVYREMCEKH